MYNIKKIKNRHIFLGFLSLNLIISAIFQEFVMTRDVYHNLLNDRLEAYRIDKQLQLMSNFKIWGYLLLPLILWIKYCFVTLLLQLPLMFKLIDIPFNKIFRVVMLSSPAILAMSALQITMLSLMPADQIDERILKVVPLSLASFIDISAYPGSAVTIFNTINLFEVLWLILIFTGFVSISREKLKKVDIILLVTGVWTFLLVLQYAFVTYMEKTFG